MVPTASVADDQTTLKASKGKIYGGSSYEIATDSIFAVVYAQVVKVKSVPDEDYIQIAPTLKVTLATKSTGITASQPIWIAKQHAFPDNDLVLFKDGVKIDEKDSNVRLTGEGKVSFSFREPGSYAVALEAKPFIEYKYRMLVFAKLAESETDHQPIVVALVNDEASLVAAAKHEMAAEHGLYCCGDDIRFKCYDDQPITIRAFERNDPEPYHWSRLTGRDLEREYISKKLFPRILRFSQEERRSGIDMKVTVEVGGENFESAFKVFWNTREAREEFQFISGTDRHLDVLPDLEAVNMTYDKNHGAGGIRYHFDGGNVDMRPPTMNQPSIEVRRNIDSELGSIVREQMANYRQDREQLWKKNDELISRLSSKSEHSEWSHEKIGRLEVTVERLEADKKNLEMQLNNKVANRGNNVSI